MITRFNTWLGEKITAGVGTMWCAYVFAALALISLPDAIHAGTSALIAWIAQTFLQLVLLSVIMVGQQAGTNWMVNELRETHDTVISKFKYVITLLVAIANKLDVAVPPDKESNE